MDPGRLRREGEIPSGPLCPGFAECIEYHAIIVTLRCWSRRSQLTRKSWISDPSSDAPGRRQHPAQRRDRLTRCSQYRVWEGLLRLQPFEDGLQRLALRRMMLAGNRKFEDLYGSFSVKFFCCGSAVPCLELKGRSSSRRLRSGSRSARKGVKGPKC